MININYLTKELHILGHSFPLEDVQKYVLTRFPEIVFKHRIGNYVKSQEINLNVDWYGIFHDRSIILILITNNELNF